MRLTSRPVALENTLESFYDAGREMKRRPPRPQRNSRSAIRSHSANDCRAIVAVDGTKIRKKIKKDYEMVLREMDISRKQLEQFHQSDLPEFTRWLNSHFGALLTELRELSQKMALDEELIYEVENELMFGRDSYAHAYKRVMEFRENPGPAVPPRDESGDRETGNLDGDEDPLKEFFNQAFGEMDPDQGPRTKEPRRTEPHPSSRLKELYRSLVRRLHPDTQREMTAQKAEWWHQSQAAYQAGDVEQLELILTLCEIGDSGTTAHTSASLLQRITEKLKSSLRELKRQIARLRKDPAWNFSLRPDHDRDSMATQMRRNLTSDLQIIRQRSQLTQLMIAEWQAAAARIDRRRRRRRSPEDSLF